MSDTVIFYFSFRSPYSRLAFHRISKIAADLPVDFEFIPIFPSKEQQQFPFNQREKLLYIREDFSRFNEAYGLAYKTPDPFDIDWVIPHAAFVDAAEQGKTIEFGIAAYEARFSEGLNISEDHVLNAIAVECKLDAENLVQAAHDPAYHEKVISVNQKKNRHHIFGVPTFIYKKHKYWGNDRIEWLLRDIYQDQGREVPDLSKDLFARPF